MEGQHQRFWSKVDRRTDEECWNWTAGTFKKGYGAFYLDGRMRKATHISLEMATGPSPEPHLQALHSCNNPPCVNPGHLRWGTHDENMQDKADHGRPWRGSIPPARRGTSNGRAKLTEKDVKDLRRCWSRGFTLSELGEIFSISISQAGRIVRRESWNHVE